MAEYTRVVNWKDIPYEARIFINGLTAAVYSPANLPSANDPGWTKWRAADGNTVRLINIHGPFALTGQEDSDRIEDGWLGVLENGEIFITENEYVRPSISSSEMEEASRPFGYKEMVE